jgi:glucose/arabinose dehydrogenase
MRQTHRLAAPVIALACVLSGQVGGATLPPGFQEVAITGAHVITDATAMAFAPDGKLFVLERAGTVEVYEGAGPNAWTREQANFFAADPLNVDTSAERGLFGIAFDPDYASNRYVYVYYTFDGVPVRNRIERHTATPNGELAIPGTAVTLMDLDPISGPFHHGGAMQFGPGGKLFVTTGDDANSDNAQDITNRFGKVLRLNPDPADPIPDSNPTSIAGIDGTLTGDNRAIWAAGLRNPYALTVRPNSSLMYIADVGEAQWEEVNICRRGANYGWGVTEGPFNQNQYPDFTQPRIYYHHNNGLLSSSPALGFTGFCVIGGAFYVTPNPTFPIGYREDYYFADFVNGWIRRYDLTTRKVKVFAQEISGPVSVLVGNDGALYYLARNDAGGASGRVYRVQRGPN